MDKKTTDRSGGGYEIIEEGLNSRTLMSDDDRPGKEGRNGFSYLKPCMDTHDPLDVVILMLGTNELKHGFHHSAQDIVHMMDQYVTFITNYRSQIDKSHPKIIISGLPPVNDKSEYCKAGNKYKDASAKCKELTTLYKIYCEQHGLLYIDNDDLTTGVDGVHLTKESHAILAQKLCKVIRGDIKKGKEACPK